ncbi:MAG TPA: TlpA disulfide reductase family protein [Ktedonobacteraceae bacterium]|nr:TlpA disulfide reductase family protein [Ktedonobacteraceae bacterium]
MPGISQTFANHGLPLGTIAPAFAAINLDGASIRLKDSNGRWRVLVFVSPGCSACQHVIDAVNSFQKERPDIAVLVIGGPDRQINQAYAVEQHADIPILTPQGELANELYLVKSVPFVYILDEAGVIRAKGVMNEREHLQQLLSEAHAPLLASQASQIMLS